MATIQDIFSAIENGKAKQIEQLVSDAISSGASPSDILNHGMIEAMHAVGERFSRGEAFVPEMLIAARTMKKGVETLKPYLSTGEIGACGTVVIGTVAGDMHDIGKNLVALMMESAGFRIVDLGVDVSAEQFMQAIDAEADVRIVALSTLLTTSMSSMRDIVCALNAHERRAFFRVMVGGAPISREFAESVGADAYTEDAAEAASVARSFAVAGA